jgi:hypothetical protein
VSAPSQAIEVALGEFGPRDAEAWQRCLIVASASADRLHLLESGALPIDAVGDEGEEPRVGRQRVHEGDRIFDFRGQTLEALA